MAKNWKFRRGPAAWGVREEEEETASHLPACLLSLSVPLQPPCFPAVCLTISFPLANCQPLASSLSIGPFLCVSGPLILLSTGLLSLHCHRAMAQGRGATVSLVLLGLGLALAIIVPVVIFSRNHSSCGPQSFAQAAVAADSKVCSDIGR